jgi:hypothetical protein
VLEVRDAIEQYLADGPYRGCDEQIMKESVALAPHRKKIPKI